MLCQLAAFAQNMEMPKGFEELRSGILTGKLDSIKYASKTVGSTRKALVYTPPGFDKKKNTRFYTSFTVLVVMKKNGSMVPNLSKFLTTSTPMVNCNR